MVQVVCLKPSCVQRQGLQILPLTPSVSFPASDLFPNHNSVPPRHTPHSYGLHKSYLFGSISLNPCHHHHPSCQELNLEVLTITSFFFLAIQINVPSNKHFLFLSPPQALCPEDHSGTASSHPHPIHLPHNCHMALPQTQTSHASLFLKKWLVSSGLMSALIGWHPSPPQRAPF